jgi:hypothetical protein
MGNTRFRSDVREHGARTASFSTIQAGTISGTVTLSGAIAMSSTLTTTGLHTATGGVSVPATSYIKLGSIYIISGAPSGAAGVFSNASINALASAALTGVVATKGDIPRGTLFINASVNNAASSTLLVKIGLASWTGVSGTRIQD